MLDRLTRDERLLLLRFVCSFAWADGDVAEEERRFVRRLVARFDLAEDETLDVESWLVTPPDAPEPSDVPEEHRRAFLETARAMMFIDGKIDPAEEAHFALLRSTLG